MRPNRFSIVCAIVVLASVVACLVSWALLWRPLQVLRLAEWAYLPPLSAIGLGVAAYALMAWTRDRPRSSSDPAAIGVLVLGSVLLVEHLLVGGPGIESWLFGGAVQTLLEGTHPGLPTPFTLVCMMFLGGAVLFGTRSTGTRFGPADVFALAALFPAFTIVLGYLYQAPILVDTFGPPPMYLPEALLLMALALGVLSMNPQGALAPQRERDVGTDARRKLMPAAVLTPALLGLAQAVALRGGILDPVLAVALTSVAGILVSIVLIEWVAGLLAEREAEKEGEMRERESQVREEGMTDALTGLLNRRGWDQRFAALEERYQREGGNACVIVIDLDGLKVLNDSQGHQAGDALIKRAARALEAAGRRDDFVARLGGDEFAYLAVDCLPQHAEIVETRLAGALMRASVQASIGYAMRDLAGSLAAAFKEADEAMYADKRARKAARKQA